MRPTPRTALWMGLVLLGCAGPAATRSDESDAGAPPTNGDMNHDAGADPDAGPLVDAGSETDAGVEADAGVDAGPPVASLYDTDGPTTFTVHTQHPSSAGRSMNVTVYMPSTPGPHPLVSFSCGSTQTAAGYVPYARRLASYGIATFLTDDPGALTQTSTIVPGAVYVVDTWAPANYAGQIDFSRVGLGGHSRGGAVSLLAAEGGLRGKVVAWFGLDPVDNQFGTGPGVYARTSLSGIGIPTAFLGASVTSNCAPTADSYPTLYPLTPSPSVLIVGNGAGHTQLEEPGGCTLCSVCSPSGTADGSTVLAYAVRYFTAFFARELLGDASVGATFQGAGATADVAAGRVTITSK